MEIYHRYIHSEALLWTVRHTKGTGLKFNTPAVIVSSEGRRNERRRTFTSPYNLIDIFWSWHSLFSTKFSRISFRRTQIFLDAFGRNQSTRGPRRLADFPARRVQTAECLATRRCRQPFATRRPSSASHIKKTELLPGARIPHIPRIM